MILDDKIISRREFLEKSGLAIATIAGINALLTNTVFGEESLEQLTLKNFSEKVYQNKKPVIVLFTGSGAYNSAANASKRMREVILGVKEKYKDKINFFELNVDKLTFNEYVNLIYNEKYHKRMSKQEISEIPITCMYHREDFLTGKKHNLEEPNFEIDRINGGPISDEYAKQWVRDIPVYWINPNIFKVPTDDGHLYRFNNTGDYQDMGKIW